MKKIISVLLLAALLVSLAACGTTASPASSSASSSAPAAAVGTPVPTATPEICSKSVAQIVAEPGGKELLQDALVQTALAFYYQDPNPQYDSEAVSLVFGSKTTGGMIRTLHVTPEEAAAADRRYISQCSSFVYDIYYNTFNTAADGSGSGFETYGGIGPKGNWHSSGSGKTYMDKIDDPNTVIYVYKQSGDVPLEEGLAKMDELLEPGDIIYGDGHIMIYLGDCFGDGIRYALHSWPVDGGKGNTETGEQKFEPKGSITLQSYESLCVKGKEESGKVKWQLGVTKTAENFGILRPILHADMKDYYISAATAARLENRYMSINKVADKSVFEAVQPNSNVTVTETVYNHGTEAYSGLTLTEAIPQGTTFAGCSEGGTEKDGVLTWTLNVPAGGSAEVTYTFTVGQAIGESFTVPGGYLNTLPTRSFPLKVGYAGISKANQEILLAASKQLPDTVKVSDTFMDLDFANEFYRGVFGIELNLPKTIKELLPLVTESLTIGDYQMMQPKARDDANAAIYDMTTPFYPGGKYVLYNTDLALDGVSRILEIRMNDAQPGDIYISCGGSNVAQHSYEIDIYLGAGRALKYTENGLTTEKFTESAGALIRQSYFVMLRPSRTFDSLSK